MTEKVSKKLEAPACDGCAVWTTFGNKCWYFWERKKHCSVKTNSLL
tara:strand:+ start:6220 stop:6357 length:138 start_codon:yes stop_codon:yes gene_type:complete